MFLCVGLLGCALDGLVSNDTLPEDILDPKAVKTPEGAMGAYFSTLAVLSDGLASYTRESGLLADELQVVAAIEGFTGAYFPAGEDLIDARGGHDNRLYSESYGILHKIRGHAREGIGALRTYHPGAPQALIGHLMAVEGMAVVMLAELYCSGIPLSRLDFGGGYTQMPGSSTKELYLQALALFDSALVLSADSVRIIHFTNVGRARALLALDSVASAADAVIDIPTNYVYQVGFTSKKPNGFQAIGPVGVSAFGLSYSVANNEGGTGIEYVSGNDPRTAAEALARDGDGLLKWYPKKYVTAGMPLANNDGSVPIILASGIEARLIEAEAALVGGGTQWLSILNTLRSSCATAAACPVPAPAGTGGIEGLPPLTDPGTESLRDGQTPRSVRIDRLFSERAAWLFLTGHRQGDFRRLVRNYKRDANTVYPTGAWGIQQRVPFGTDVNLPVPEMERSANPLYRGCFSRDA